VKERVHFKYGFGNSNWKYQGRRLLLGVSRSVVAISLSMIEKAFTKRTGQYPGCFIEEYIYIYIYIYKKCAVKDKYFNEETQ
jgi:hypothetical protein